MRLDINYEQRVAKLRGQLIRNDFKAAVLSKIGSLNYYTGTVIKDRAALMIPADDDKDPVLIASDVEAGRIAYESCIRDVREYSFLVTSRTIPTYGRAIAEALSKAGVGNGKVGLEMDDLTVSEYEELRTVLPDANVSSISGLLGSLMVIKDRVEIERLRRSAEIVEAGMNAAWKALKVGMTETEVAGVAEYAMRLAGSESHTFGIGGRVGTEVASGYRTGYLRCWSMPPTSKRIQAGDLVLLDIHCLNDLYVSDLTLNAVMGRPSNDQQRLADVWKAACDALLGSMKPGMSMAQTATSVRKLIEKAGFGNYVGALFGHGLGTSTRIPPRVSEVSEGDFQENMTLEAVVTIACPEIGGLRLELPVVITAKGAEPLVKTKIDLREIEI